MDLDKDYDDIISGHMVELDPDYAGLLPQPKVAAPVKGTPYATANWGSGSNISDAYLLGQGKKLQAATLALREGQGLGSVAGDMFTGGGTDPQGNRTLYRQNLDRIRGEVSGWKDENHGKALATDIIGSTPTVAAGVGLGGAALRAGGNALLNVGTRVAPELLMKAAPMIEGGARFASGMAGQGKGIANALIRMGSKGTVGAIEGGAGGVLGSGMNEGSVEENALMGMGVGAGLRGVVGPVLSPLLPKSGIDQTTGKLAKAGLDQGVDLRAGQVAHSPTLRGLDHMLNGRTSPEQLKQFSQALAKTFGETADDLSADTLNRAYARIGGKLDDISSQIDIPGFDQATGQFSAPAQKLFDQLSDIGLSKTANDSKLASKWFGELRKEIEDHMLAGGIPGSTYQALTQKGSKLERALNGKNPELSQLAQEVKEQLWGAAEASAGPKVMKDWAAAKLEYKNLKIANDLARVSPFGYADPTKLFGIVSQDKYYGDAVPRGNAGDIGKLAQVGKAFLDSEAKGPRVSVPLPMQIAGGLGGGAAGLWGITQGIPAAAQAFQANPTAAGMAGLGILGAGAIARNTGQAMSSPEYTNWLIKRAMEGSGPVMSWLEQAGLDYAKFAPAQFLNQGNKPEAKQK